MNEKFSNALREENKSRDDHFLDAYLLISEDNEENSENELLARINTDIMHSSSSKATCYMNYNMTSSELAIKNDEGLYEMKLNPFNEANSSKESALDSKGENNSCKIKEKYEHQCSGELITSKTETNDIRRNTGNKQKLKSQKKNPVRAIKNDLTLGIVLSEYFWTQRTQSRHF